MAPTGTRNSNIRSSGTEDRRNTIQWPPYEANEAERKTFAEGMASMHQGWSGTFERLDAYLGENR